MYFLFFYISETNSTLFRERPSISFNCAVVSGEPAGPGGGSLQAPLHFWAGNHHLQRRTQGGLAALQTDPHREGKGTNTDTSTLNTLHLTKNQIQRCKFYIHSIGQKVSKGLNQNKRLNQVITQSTQRNFYRNEPKHCRCYYNMVEL